jgi:hypothetical protein
VTKSIPPHNLPAEALSALLTPEASTHVRSRRLIIRCPEEIAAAAALAEAQGERSMSQMVAAALHLVPRRLLDTLPDFVEPSGRFRRTAKRVRVSASSRWDRAAIRRAIVFVCGIAQESLLVVSSADDHKLKRAFERANGRIEQLVDFIERLSFIPLPNGVHTDNDARYVLGLSPTSPTDAATVGTRFRSVAAVYHPDNGLPNSHARMIQLLEARRYLARWH